MTHEERLKRLSSRDRAALTDFTARLRHQFNHDNIQHVWIYGSKIRGDATLDSDIDLLIVLRDYDWELEKAITRIAVEIDLAYDVVLSDHIIDVDRYAEMARRKEPLYCNIEREGADLWKAAPQPIT